MPVTTPLVTGVDFVSMPTRDLEAASRFCGQVLGLERWAPNAVPVALHVADVAAARARLEAEGVPFHGETLDTGVCHMANFRDPDGNALMLHHRYAPRQPRG